MGCEAVQPFEPWLYATGSQLPNGGTRTQDMIMQSATTDRPAIRSDAPQRRGRDPGAPARDGIETPTEDPTSDIMVDVVAAVIEKRFGESIPAARRREIAQRAIDHYQNAPIRSYVMILAERLAIDIANQALAA